MDTWDSRQGREHTPQGYFMVGGPGLVSTFPDMMSSENSQDEGEDAGLRLRARLFLMLKGEVEWMSGAVRAKLMCEREKSACWLFPDWMRVNVGLQVRSSWLLVITSGTIIWGDWGKCESERKSACKKDRRHIEKKIWSPGGLPDPTRCCFRCCLQRSGCFSLLFSGESYTAEVSHC